MDARMVELIQERAALYRPLSEAAADLTVAQEKHTRLLREVNRIDIQIEGIRRQCAHAFGEPATFDERRDVYTCTKCGLSEVR